MTKPIGPNFTNEIAAAGLSGLPFAWSESGAIEFGNAMSGSQIAAVQAVYAAHDPARPNPVAAAAALVRAGLTVASISTPSIDGTYGCAPQDETTIIGLQAAAAQGVFPGFCRDRAGARRAMTGEQFTALATALLGFLVAIDEAKAAALAGNAWVAPPASVTIA